MEQQRGGERFTTNHRKIRQEIKAAVTESFNETLSIIIGWTHFKMAATKKKHPSNFFTCFSFSAQMSWCLSPGVSEWAEHIHIKSHLLFQQDSAPEGKSRKIKY